VSFIFARASNCAATTVAGRGKCQQKHFCSVSDLMVVDRISIILLQIHSSCFGLVVLGAAIPI